MSDSGARYWLSRLLPPAPTIGLVRRSALVKLVDDWADLAARYGVVAMRGGWVVEASKDVDPNSVEHRGKPAVRHFKAGTAAFAVRISDGTVSVAHTNAFGDLRAPVAVPLHFDQGTGELVGPCVGRDLGSPGAPPRYLEALEVLSRTVTEVVLDEPPAGP